MLPEQIGEFYRSHVEKLTKPNSSGWAQGRCPFHDDRKNSLSVHMVVGSWKCFGGCGEKGKGSVFDFARMLGITIQQPKYAREGSVVKTYDYDDENGNFLYQKVLKDNKDFQWRRRKDGDWVYNLKDIKRVPYKLKQLLAVPIDEPIFIVEGEKCADTLSCLGVFATTSGAANSWHKDLNPYFKDRNIVLWQDNDAAGNTFASSVIKELLPIVASIKHLHIEDGRDGSDAEDWILQGGTKEKLLEEIKKLPAIKQATVTVPVPQKSPAILWHEFDLSKSANGQPIINLDNAAKILEKHEPFKNALWFDIFHRKMYSTIFSNKPLQWSDSHDLELTRMFQNQFGLTKIKEHDAARAVRLVAYRNIRNEPKEWLESLQWDGVERVASFFPEAYGSHEDVYSISISNNFWVSAIARIMSPGCQVDNMVVLEGAQGIGKSRSLRAIAGPWYTSVTASVMEKDFYMILSGALIAEIAELDSFRKAEITRVKQVISDPHDNYRAPYAREPHSHPRMSIFVGTTNEYEYLKDTTGGRRFWPIKCGQIKHDYIEKYREQFFAEALVRYKSGMTWWEVPEIVREEQEARRITDPWEEIIYDFLIGKHEVTFNNIIDDALSIPKERSNHTIQTRIGRILRLLGWDKKQRRTTPGGPPRIVWRPVNQPVEP